MYVIDGIKNIEQAEKIVRQTYLAALRLIAWAS
jgi:hypothetical protein